MFKYTKLAGAVRYDNPSWPGFYVLIVSNEDDSARNVYLTHSNMGIIHYMHGAIRQSDGTMETMEETVEHAHWAMEDYLPDFVRDCCTDRDD